MPDITSGRLAIGFKVAAALSADGYVKNSGYFDEPAKAPTPGKPTASDTRVDDQIRVKKAADRQKQKDFLLDDIKRANPKAGPAKWDARAEERLREMGY